MKTGVELIKRLATVSCIIADKRRRGWQELDLYDCLKERETLRKELATLPDLTFS